VTLSEAVKRAAMKSPFSKLHVYDRTQAMLYAIRKGLVRIE